MGLEEEIFREFIEKLREDENFPSAIVAALERLWKSGEIFSQDVKEKLRNIIEGGCSNER